MSNEAKKPVYKRISFRINLSKIDKEHCTIVQNQQGENEVIGDFLMNFTEDDIEVETKKGGKYTHNGFVSQNVNKETYESEKEKPFNQRTNLGILGNAKYWRKQIGADEQGIPGAPMNNAVTDAEAKKVTDKLPF